MMYKAKVTVCSDIRRKHSTQSERHVEFLNVKPWWYGKKPPGFKRLIYYSYVYNHHLSSAWVFTGTDQVVLGKTALRELMEKIGVREDRRL